MNENQEPRTKNPSGRSASEYSFRNLIVWQKAQNLTVDVVTVTSSLPRSAANDVVVRQVLRSASSIAANIAEGHGRFTPRAHANHLSITKGSACETDGWLDLLRRMGMLAPDAETKLHQQWVELIAMLTAEIRDLNRRAGSALAKGEL